MRYKWLFSRLLASAIFAPFIVGVFFFSATVACAATYSWTDAEGKTHYTNDPYVAKDHNAKPVSGMSDMTNLETDPPRIAFKQEPSQDIAKDEEAKEADKKEGLTIVDGPNYMDTMSGDTLFTVTLRNDLDAEVNSIRFDLSIVLKSGQRGKRIPILFKGGKKPGFLAPGESAVLEQILNITEDQIGGIDYKISFNYDILVETPKEGEPLPEGVKHIIIPGKPAAEGETGEGATPQGKTSSEPESSS